MRKKLFIVLAILLLMLFTSCGNENVNYTIGEYYSAPAYTTAPHQESEHEESETEPITNIIIEETMVNSPADSIELQPNAVSISAAHGQNLVVMTDGSLWSWGTHCVQWFSNTGDGIGANQRVPIKIMENVVYAVAGPHHSFAITADGGMYTWGGNSWGNLGDGTTEVRLSPVRVLDDVISAAMPLGVPCSHVGYIGARTYAIRSDSSLWAWGNGVGGAWPIALGDGGETNQHSPVQIMENVRIVVPTGQGGLAITNDNILWAWYGRGWIANPDGGDPIEIPAQLYPIPIKENVASLSSCGSFAISTNNVLFSLGTFINRTEPAYIMSNVVYATRLGNANFAITTEGTLYAWGENRLPSHWRSGPTLGDGTTIDRETPVRILENIAQVLAVGNTVYAIGSNGTLWGWGNFGASWGGNILLGDGSEFIAPNNPDEFWEYAYTYEHNRRFVSGLRWLLPDCGGTELRLYPVKIMENVVQVAATYYMFDHGWIRSFRAFAITENGELWAWGENDDFDRGFSLLGDGTSERRAYPVRIIYGE